MFHPETYVYEVDIRRAKLSDLEKEYTKISMIVDKYMHNAVNNDAKNGANRPPIAKSSGH